jgi:dihydrofolate reductase
MTLSIIVAMTEDRVIGRNNQLPWHISEDLQRFKKLTMGHPIVMGRKTFESIGKPLPGRANIVVTRNPSLALDGVTITGSLKEAIEKGKQAEGGKELFVIGGAAMFDEALPLADKIYLTQIHHKIPGDVFFPPFNLKKDFTIIEETHHQSTKGEPLNFSFMTGVRHGHS